MVAHLTLSRPNKNELYLGSAFVLSILVGGLLLWPGISGDFLLDDYENLKKLEQISDFQAFSEWLNFLRTGISSNLGRPISLLSFAFQHYEFPFPGAFKYVNVLIHLVNACLVFWLLILITRLCNLFGEKAHWIALIAAILWLVHPLQISTVHYVIQRMTELSALFTLAGIILYLTGRQQFVQNKTVQGYLWTSLGVILGGCLATLSKETGILLPLYILVLEFTLLRHVAKPKHWNLWVILFLATPLVIFVTYLGFNFNKFVINSYSRREFTIVERLLTESRVLSDYLFKIILPLPRELGLYHDDFTISKTLFNPLQTFFAAAFLVALPVSAVYFKNRAPIYSFGVLWFLSGHLLESTLIPLELYFEHRNYLPSLGIILMAIYYASRLPGVAPNRTIKNLVIACAVLYGSAIVFISYNENLLWGNTYQQSVTWAAENPKSLRAQDALGAVLTATEQYHKAASVYKNMTNTFPENAFPYVIWLGLTCLDPTIDPPPTKTLLVNLQRSSYHNAVLVGFNRIIASKEAHDCKAIKYDDLELMLDTLMKNTRYKNRLMHLHLYLGRLYAAQRLLSPAIMEYDKAFAISRNPDIALRQVEWLSSAGLYDEALVYLEKAEHAAQRTPVLQMSLHPILRKWRNVLTRLQTNE